MPPTPPSTSSTVTSSLCHDCTSRQTLSLAEARTLRVHDLSVKEARILLKVIARISPKKVNPLNNIARMCNYQPLALRVIGAFLAPNADLTADRCAQTLVYYNQSLSWENVECVSLEAALRMIVVKLDQENPELAKHWRMLTVFPASFDRTATAAVWKVGEGEAGYKLDAIVQRSLLLYDPEKDRYRLHGAVHPVARYFIDGRIRNYYSAEEPNFLVAAAARHAAHYETVLRMADQLYQQGNEELWRGLEQFDFEWRNIQVGQAWAENHSKEDDKAAELCSAYADAGVHLLGLRQHPTEQISWFEAAVTAARRLKDPGGEIAHLGYMASLYSDLGKTSRAIELYQRRLEITQDIGNLQDESKIMSDLGLAYATLGETNRAIEIYKQALAIDREMNNRQGEGAILANLGNAYFASGEFQRAVEVSEQAQAIASELGGHKGDGKTLSNMGYAHATLGQASQAIKFYEQSLPLLRESGDRFREGNTLGNLGNACFATGEFPRAVEVYERALAIARETGDREGEGVALRDLGNAYIALGKPRQAIMCSEQCLTILYEISDSLGKNKETKFPGLTYFVLGEPRRTIEFSQKCLSILRESGNVRGEARALFTMSLTVDALGNRDEAIAQAEAALKIYEGTKSSEANMVRKQLDRWRKKR